MVTVNMELKALKAALNTALRWNLIESNPFQELQQVSELRMAFRFTKSRKSSDTPPGR